MSKDVMSPNPEVLWGMPNKAVPGSAEKVIAEYKANSLGASKQAADTLREKFGEKVLDVREFRGEVRVEVAGEDLPEVLRFLRDEPALSFKYLSQAAAAEWHKSEQTPLRTFYVTYDLYSFDLKARISVYAILPKENPHLPSVAHLFTTADWHEREIGDLFGIRFENHPDPRRILLPPNYDGHPLRKDYPARGKALWNLGKNVIPSDLDEILDRYNE